MRNEHTEREESCQQGAGTCTHKMTRAGDGTQSTTPFCPHACHFNPSATTEIQRYVKKVFSLTGSGQASMSSPCASAREEHSMGGRVCFSPAGRALAGRREWLRQQKPQLQSRLRLNQSKYLQETFVTFLRPIWGQTVLRGSPL